ncbi:MAG: DNA polymerase I [Candidatus Zixiibacteriota bacterium]
MNGKSLFLIDGSAIFYRAYFAFIRNPLINSKGENTSATFGFLNSIFKVIREENPDYIAVVFDTKEPTFRHKMYDEYKSTRAKMPDDLVLQLPRIHESVAVLNLPSLELAGYEADDIIGTLAKAGEKKGMEVKIVSGDKDMFQLVSDKIKMYIPQKGSIPPDILDAEGVKNKFGVYPDRIIDALSLMGDSSDNVPGVPGVGPKTAISLLEEFGTLEQVLENCDRIKAKGVRTKVSENIDRAKLSQKLVTIDTNVPVEFSLKEMARREVNFERAKKFFIEMEFNALLNELAKWTGHLDLQLDKKSEEKKAEKVKYIGIHTVADLEKLVEKLSTEKEIALDTETTGLDSLTADLVGVSLCAKEGEAYYIPVNHNETEKNVPIKEAVKLFNKLFKNKKVGKIGQNMKFDLEILHHAGIDVNPISFDTMLASYVINPSGRRHGLDAMALDHFSYKMQPITELIGTGRKQKSFAEVPVDDAVFYAAEDADYTFRLKQVLEPKLRESKVDKLFYEIELPLVEVLTTIEENGVRVDDKFLAKLSKDMDADLERLIKDIYIEAGKEFNINSTQQLAAILFDELKLPTRGKTTKKTAFSTDQKVLEELAEIHPLPRFILDYRQLTKLKSTYIDAIPKLINPNTGRVHTSFNQTIAATGRLSSTDPNLQNIPIRTETGREIRKAFIPRDKDFQLLVADYSQVELRILAHFSEDKKLIEAFKNKEDIHTRTAAEVYGVKPDDVTREMRRAAKTANFAVIYGVSAYGLSQQTELNFGESKDFIATYFDRYPGIKKYMDDMIESAKKNGYVKTLFDRIRYLPEINAKNYQVRQFAERMAINTPIQGTAADMIKVAMINIHKKISKMQSKMILQVHDELVFDVHRDEIEELKQIVRDGMEKAVKLKAPIVADMGVGDNWLDAK